MCCLENFQLVQAIPYFRRPYFTLVNFKFYSMTVFAKDCSIIRRNCKTEINLKALEVHYFLPHVFVIMQMGMDCLVGVLNLVGDFPFTHTADNACQPILNVGLNFYL